jgi:ribulose-phosphate 3-epimerase
MDTLVVPSIIAKTQTELDGMLGRVRGKIKRVQLDVMDGKFVPNTSLDFDFKLTTGFEYEAHLMVKTPLEWVKKNADKVDIVTMHVETLKDIEAAIDFVKEKAVKTDLALIPKTELGAITPYLKKIDGLLVMTVEPGSYCIKKEFHPEPLQKIRELRKIDDTIPVEVDGCMNPENARLAKNHGANIFASGSYIFKSKNVGRAIRELKDAVS